MHRKVCFFVRYVVCGLSLLFAQPQPSAQTPLPDEWAHKILNTVGDDAASASPDVRAYIWLRLALRSEDDHQKQVTLFKEAYLATLQIPVLRYNTRAGLQVEILYAMLEHTGPAALEEVMPKADDDSRYTIRSFLITRYADDGKIDRALELLKGAPDQGMFPFGAAGELMAKLPLDKVALRRAIFAQALALASSNYGWNIGAVAPMVQKFWRDLPKSQALMVIEKVLQRARQTDACPMLDKTNVYAYYVDQFLPILRELDPARAEALAREKASGGPPVEECDYGKMYAPQPTATPDRNATPTPTPAPRWQSWWAELLAAVRHSTANRKPRTVFGCETMGFCRQDKIEHMLTEVINHLKRNETEAAKHSIDRGFSMAVEEWKYDTDEDDPNGWNKSIWPSTENWEAFTLLASFISAQYALERIAQIPDPDIRLMAREKLADYWLGSDPDWRPPNFINNEGEGCECIAYYRYIPRHRGEKFP